MAPSLRRLLARVRGPVYDGGPGAPPYDLITRNLFMTDAKIGEAAMD